MRFKRIQAKCFGRLMDARLEDLDHRPVVLCSPNEGGKSTWMKVIETLLYGFNPAKSDNHPYTCWNGGNMDLSADLILKDGQGFSVSRRMLATPRGQLSIGAKSNSIGNKALPMLDHVPRDIFCGIYSLTLEDMQIFKDETWDTIQDKLLSNFGVDFLNAPRVVLEKLESDANQLWRKDRRRTIAKGIEEQIAELKKERGEALRRYEAIRKLDEERVKIIKDIEEKKESIVDIKAKLRRAERLNPARRKLMRIEELKEQIGDLQILNALPDDLDRQLQTIAEALYEGGVHKEKLLKELEAFENTLYVPTAGEQFLLEQKPQLKTLTGERGLYASDRERIEDLSRAIESRKDQLIKAAEDIMTQPWDETMTEAVKSIPKAELNAKIKSFKEAQQDLRKVEQEKAGVEAAVSVLNVRPFPKVALIILLISFCVLRAGFAFKTGILTGLGTIFAALSLSSILYWRRSRSEQEKFMEQHKGRIASVNSRFAAAKAEVSKKMNNLEEMLKALPIAPAYLKNPDEGLLSGIEALQQNLRLIENMDKEMKQIRLRYEGKLQKLREIAGDRQGFEATLPEQWITVLDNELQVIEDKIRLSQTSQREIDRLKRELADLEQRIDELKQKEHNLHTILRQFGEDNIQAALNTVLQKKRLYLTLVDADQDLRKDYSDLNKIAEEIAAVDVEFDWIFSDEEVERAKQKLEELNNELIELEKLKLQCVNDIKQLEKETSLDAIDSELDMLNEELNDVLRKRDELELLHTIVLKADQLFREQHQPDVLKNAEKYLNIITGGRYTSLYFDEQDGAPVLMTKIQGNSYPIPVSHPLSRGTLDQIYLSLRLSLMDHLDKDNETLPLCMDEILVNWDGQRLHFGLQLMEEIAQNRQIFLFTCHSWLADIIGQKFSAQVVNL